MSFSLEAIDHVHIYVRDREAADHEVSWSVYFKDPDGNPYEVTTYDYEDFANSIARAG